MIFFPLFSFPMLMPLNVYMCVCTKCWKNVGKIKIPRVISSKKFSFAKKLSLRFRY